ETMGVDAAISQVEQRWRGLSMLRALLDDAAMGYESLGGCDLIRLAEQPALERLDEVNRLLHPVFGEDVFFVDDRRLQACGFGPEVLTLVANRLEGQLHSGQTMNALGKLARQHGVEIVNGAHVERLESRSDGVDV